jgi:hypothetical protein
VDQHGRRRENAITRPKAREDNCGHLGLKATTKGNSHPRENEECTGHEELAGKAKGCTNEQASKTGSVGAITTGSIEDDRKTASREGENQASTCKMQSSASKAHYNAERGKVGRVEHTG